MAICPGTTWLLWEVGEQRRRDSSESAQRPSRGGSCGGEALGVRKGQVYLGGKQVGGTEAVMGNQGGKGSQGPGSAPSRQREAEGFRPEKCLVGNGCPEGCAEWDSEAEKVQQLLSDLRVNASQQAAMPVPWLCHPRAMMVHQRGFGEQG